MLVSAVQSWCGCCCRFYGSDDVTTVFAVQVGEGGTLTFIVVVTVLSIANQLLLSYPAFLPPPSLPFQFPSPSQPLLSSPLFFCSFGLAIPGLVCCFFVFGVLVLKDSS